LWGAGWDTAAKNKQENKQGENENKQENKHRVSAAHRSERRSLERDGAARDMRI
jgi:hypothetical protein